MFLTLTVAALLAGVSLLSLLAWTCLDPRARFWPSPSTWSWQSLLFWALFRTLNLSALALAFLDWQPGLVHSPERWFGGAVAAGCFVLYGLACYTLGHANLYCGKEGLVVKGVYRWTRNPQYGTAIPAYLGLALASQSLLALLPIALLVIVFTLMAMAEEPWLRTVYGDGYARYCQRVPRFYNWLQPLDALRLALLQARKTLKEMRSEA